MTTTSSPTHQRRPGRARRTRTLDIGVDADGVMYPFVSALRRYAMLVTGRPLEHFPVPKNWDFATEWGLSSAELLQLMHDAVDNGALLLDGAPYPGVISGLHDLKRAGHRIHVVTDRDGLGRTAGLARLRTQAWLERWNLPYDTLTFTPDKTSVRTDVFIEDKPENYLALCNAGVDTYLRDHPYNTHVTAPQGRRVPTFGTFAEVVLAEH